MADTSSTADIKKRGIKAACNVAMNVILTLKYTVTFIRQLGGLVVSIPACAAGDPGSNPGWDHTGSL